MSRFQVFDQLKKSKHSRLGFDPTQKYLSGRGCYKADWSELYEESEDVTPPNAPNTIVKGVSINFLLMISMNKTW